MGSSAADERMGSEGEMADLELDFVGGGGEDVDVDVDVDVDEEGFDGREEGHDAPINMTGQRADEGVDGGARDGGRRRDGKEGRRVGMRVGAGRWVEAEEEEGEGVGRVREARVRSLIEEEEGGEGGVYD